MSRFGDWKTRETCQGINAVLCCIVGIIEARDSWGGRLRRWLRRVQVEAALSSEITVLCFGDRPVTVPALLPPGISDHLPAPHSVIHPRLTPSSVAFH
ncbi:hypothetical protein TNCT_178141 [Trichonephila clavata]|uniref:Uncharacterized protein n=1 Tax=Trichonephila clavata TaxID=2740835 RepID=A0A8X6HEJ0_TRICU|nr:hypothetical protein TNCT_178141 [Trichonephila clavata]